MHRGRDVPQGLLRGPIIIMGLNKHEGRSTPAPQHNEDTVNLAVQWRVYKLHYAPDMSHSEKMKINS